MAKKFNKNAAHRNKIATIQIRLIKEYKNAGKSRRFFDVLWV